MGRYFIGLLPPNQIQVAVNQVKEDCVRHYASRKAQNSPPHITLQPPFEWLPEQIPTLEAVLAAFAHCHDPLPLQLSGFGAFAPRVIYINVVTSPELALLQQALSDHLEQALRIVPQAARRPYKPHMTVAFRDLSKQNFRRSWVQYQHRPFEAQFIATGLTLLSHNGQHWEAKTEFAFGGEQHPVL